MDKNLIIFLIIAIVMFSLWYYYVYFHESFNPIAQNNGNNIKNESYGGSPYLQNNHKEYYEELAPVHGLNKRNVFTGNSNGCDSSDDNSNNTDGSGSHNDNNSNLPIEYIDFPESAEEEIKRKMETRDHALPGHYKSSSYRYGRRSGDAKEMLEFIDESNDLLQPGVGDCDNYKGIDETDGKYATYKAEKNHVNKYDINEIFNVDKYLPNKDSYNPEWFDLPPEAIPVNNRSLINTSRAITINTVGGSKRNSGWDIRGSPPIAKRAVGPWNQSTIEHDINITSLCPENLN
jgi:hypothetical protein